MPLMQVRLRIEHSASISSLTLLVSFHSCTPCSSIEAKEKQREGAKPSPAGAEADVRIVKLNIGGFKYSTTRATLLSIQNSYFAALLEERIPTAKDEKGAYFIDRDGQFFPPILTYLRTKELNIAPHERKSVLREAKFYLLSPLVHLLQSNNGLEDELQQSRWHSQALKVPSRSVSCMQALSC